MRNQYTDGPSPAERFLSKIEKSDTPDGCWLYTGGLKNGYGHFWFQGATRRAHRIAWVFAFGPIPDGLRVCHRCDVRNCVRPDHLWLGTDLDNVRDKLAKGRGRAPRGDNNSSRKHPERLPHGDAHWMRKYPERVRRGEQCSAAKLTWPKVHAIRAAAASGERYGPIAARFGISKPNVCLIVRNRAWRE